MKKVLVFGLSSNLGGVETVFDSFYDYLSNKGYCFDFITRDNKLAFQEKYKKGGARIFNVPNFLTHPIRYYNEIRRIMRNNKYDIVHINMLSAANPLPAFAARKIGIRNIIVHSHNNNTTGILRKMMHFFGKFTVRKPDVVKIACSEGAGKYLFGNKNYTIVNNPFNPDSFKHNKAKRKEIREKLNIPNNSILLGSVGRLEKQKNPLFLIDVLANIRKTTSVDYRLMLVGEGKLRNSITKRAEKLGVSDSIILVGRVNDASSYYSAIDLFVMPSNYEGFGMVALEAQASGLPCVLSEKVPSTVDVLSVKHLALKVSDWTEYILSVGKRRLTVKPVSFDKFSINDAATSLAQIYDNNAASSLIDFVVMWVDPNDQEWQKEKAKYTPEKNTDSSARRYRDWDNLRYWFRGVEKYAPWVNNIFFVTYGHIPKWLNTAHPKLKIIKHDDYIPKEYLPTFSANPIEMNLYRIKDLSENFVFFNDDFFLMNDTKPTDFFKNGLPCDSACMYINVPSGDVVDSLFYNDMAIINRHFSMKETIRKNFFKWFNLKNGKYLYNNIALSVYGGFAGIHFSHLPASFKKSTLEKIWQEEYEKLDETSRHRFRSAGDVNQWLLKYWQICSGEFVPRSVKWGKYYEYDMGYDVLAKLFHDKKYKTVCLNDTVDDDEFENAKRITNGLFAKKFPDKSEFEKE